MVERAIVRTGGLNDLSVSAPPTTTRDGLDGLLGIFSTWLEDRGLLSNEFLHLAIIWGSLAHETAASQHLLQCTITPRARTVNADMQSPYGTRESG